MRLITVPIGTEVTSAISLYFKPLEVVELHCLGEVLRD